MARTAEITFKEFRRRYNTEDASTAVIFSSGLTFLLNIKILPIV